MTLHTWRKRLIPIRFRPSIRGTGRLSSGEAPSQVSRYRRSSLAARPGKRYNSSISKSQVRHVARVTAVAITLPSIVVSLSLAAGPVVADEDAVPSAAAMAARIDALVDQ